MTLGGFPGPQDPSNRTPRDLLIIFHPSKPKKDTIQKFWKILGVLVMLSLRFLGKNWGSIVSWGLRTLSGEFLVISWSFSIHQNQKRTWSNDFWKLGVFLGFSGGFWYGFWLILDSMILGSWLFWVEWLIQGPQARKVSMSSLIFGSWDAFLLDLWRFLFFFLARGGFSSLAHPLEFYSLNRIS